MATGTLTGASTAMVVSWLEDRQGSGTVDRLFERLDGARGVTFDRSHLCKTGKVDYRVHTTVLEEVADLADADEATLREIGRDGAANLEDVIPGAGMMLRFAGPQRLLNRARTLWSTYADFGDVEVQRVEDGYARLRIHGFDTHPHFCRTLEGLFEGIVERAGTDEVEVREAEHDEPHGCVFEGRWD
jgi:uncharacterized protein (TIGR02265 family)